MTKSDYHEIVHTSHIIADIVQKHIIEHKAVKKNKKLMSRACEISDLLGEFYQEAGTLMFDAE